MKQWESFCQQQQKVLGKQTVDKWLRSLKVLRFDAWNLYLEANDSFQVSWFEEHIRPQLKTFLNPNHHPIKVHLLFEEKAAKEKKKENSPSFLIEPDPLDPSYTFSTFYPTEHGKIAHQLFLDICEKKQSFNPVFLYGPSGWGKTHLLMAAAAALQKEGLRIFFVQAETFTAHVVQAIRLGNMDLFRKTYRNTDVLLVDDVHIFSRKSATQEEFFHTFNSLHTLEKQIILTGHSLPSVLEGIEPRLISRFEWGVCVSIEKGKPSDLKTLLEKKGKELNLSLSPSLTEFFLTHFSRNPKILMEAVNSYLFRSHQQKTTDPEFLLKDLLIKEKERTLSLEKIVSIVSDYFGITYNDILGKVQSQEYSLPRQIAMYFCRKRLKLPFMKIGLFFKRDHSTVMTSVKQVEKILSSEQSNAKIALREISKKLEI